MSKSILVVDDEAKIVQIVRDYLERAGFNVLSAADGPAALAAVRARTPDLVVLDRNMPGLGGKETLVRLRLTHPNLPVLMASGQIDQSALDLAAQDSHLSLVGKPFSMEELGRKVTEAVDHGGRTSTTFTKT